MSQGAPCQPWGQNAGLREKPNIYQNPAERNLFTFPTVSMIRDVESVWLRTYGTLWVELKFASGMNLRSKNVVVQVSFRIDSSLVPIRTSMRVTQRAPQMTLALAGHPTRWDKDAVHQCNFRDRATPLQGKGVPLLAPLQSCPGTNNAWRLRLLRIYKF